MTHRVTVPLVLVVLASTFVAGMALAAGPSAEKTSSGKTSGKDDEPTSTWSLPTPDLQDAEKKGLKRIEPAAAVDAPTVVLKGATVLTATGQRYAPGYVVLKGGKIADVGQGDPPAVDGAKVVDVAGDVVTPGLIDTHSHLGVYASPGGQGLDDGNEASAPTTAGVWAEHSIWPQDPGFERAVAGGITAMEILPGSANLIGGRGLVIHAVPARGGRGMRFEGAPETVKMACGENPKRVYGGKGGAPSTRMGNLRGQREAFLAAQEYEKTWQEYEKKLADWREATAPPEDGEKRKDAGKRPPKNGSGKPEPGDEPRAPARDLAAETLVGVMQGRILPEVHCYRADDMLSFLQLADEFGFHVRSFHHALEAYKIRDVLAQQQVAVSTWADWWGFKEEAYDGIPENLALVTEAGVRGIVHSDSEIGIQRLNQEAAKAYYSGLRAGVKLTEDDALRWVTINPAWALGIDDQVGTLEKGKRADVVVWDGDPFSVYTRARLVYIDGVLRYDEDRPQVWSDFEIGQEVAP